ncbi:MAG: hypothetical protein V1917_01230 [Candidatus Gottesmanbacteria bacterium]
MIVSYSVYVLICHKYSVWDENHYMSLAVGFYDLFHQGIWEMVRKIWTISGYRQPLYGFILSLPLCVFGTIKQYSERSNQQDCNYRYLCIKKQQSDFPYTIDVEVYRSVFTVVYEDDQCIPFEVNSRVIQ